MKKYDIGMKIKINGKGVYVLSLTNYDREYNESLYNLIDIGSGVRYYEEPKTLRELNEDLDKMSKVEVLTEDDIKINNEIELVDYYSCKDSIKFSVNPRGELETVMEVECENDEYIPISVTLTPYDAHGLKQFLNDEYGEQNYIVGGN